MVSNIQSYKWMVGWLDGWDGRLSRLLRLLRAPNGANNWRRIRCSASEDAILYCPNIADHEDGSLPLHLRRRILKLFHAHCSILHSSIVQTWAEAPLLLQTPCKNGLFEVLMNIKHSEDKLDM